MKKIINGKKYDTTTAELLGKWSNGRGYSDFSYMKEILFRKKNGEYFIHGSGGPMTKYASYHGNSSSEGENIIPISEYDAKKWVEDHINSKYEEIFGECEE